MYLLILHQAGALSYEKTHGCNSWLDNKVSPDKTNTNSINIPAPNNSTAFLTQTSRNDVGLKVLSSTNDEEEVIKFETNSTNSYVDSCTTGGLTRFMDYFIPGIHQEIEERSSDTTTRKSTMVGESLEACTLNN